MMPTSEFSTSIRRLLSEIGYRHEPFPSYDAEFREPFHLWISTTLGPTSSWGPKKLAEVEHTAGGIAERSYPYASTQLKLLFAKLTAIVTIIDDSIEDEAVYKHLVQFSAKLYRGEAQQNELLAVYNATLKELSEVYGDDSVLRGLAIVPWINFVDACLMEKQIFGPERSKIVDPVQLRRFGNEDSLALKFPHYLRSKTGIAEAYAAGIFKATESQYLPLQKYIKALPDLTFYIEAFNDILSFHKEEIAGETYNLIHLRTRSISSSGVPGTGANGEWTPYDTLRLLCDEVIEAAHRIDGLLRLDECERKLRGEAVESDVDEVDIQIAIQWSGYRHGYVSWHLECRRYQLGSLKLALDGGAPEGCRQLETPGMIGAGDCSNYRIIDSCYIEHTEGGDLGKTFKETESRYSSEMEQASERLRPP
ncbi:Terpenoid synthase [Mycena sanguinolenta]|uniref:Terpenoid synthase n=1 Tax=Mycena sanguinolenta TaxID=230812 RepID=A0A8H6U3F3_9AGAR|nr:Terpenoid synthase [Mycena sanguinolenta]